MSSLDGGVKIVEGALDTLELALKLAQACGWDRAIDINRRLDALRQGWWKVAGSPKPQEGDEKQPPVSDNDDSKRYP